MPSYNINICFVGNFFKTPVFKAIADGLSPFGINAYWILLKKSQYDEFLNYYPKDQLLLLDRSWIKINSTPIGDYKLNELVFGDRIWKYKKKEGRLFLTNIQKPVFDFLKNNSIRLVFGEMSWSHEILIYRMCSQLKELNCRYYTQMVTRIPRNRFFFFQDEKSSQIVNINNRSSIKIGEIKVEKPAYLAINNKIVEKKRSLFGVLKRLYYYISNVHIEPTDPCVFQSRWLRLKVAGKEVFNQQTYRFLHRATLDDIEGKKYVFYGFHMQPEASIDVCGRYNDDQSLVVLNIWRQLPSDWLLVIKEHSNAVGNRSVCFFKKLLRYPNVILINEYTDSHKIIEKAQLVIINTGTMGLEAALLGVPAISLSKVYFNVLNYCRYITWQEMEKYDSILELIDDIKSKGDNREALNELVQNYSFEGTLGDVQTMPDIINEVNVSNLVSAFRALLDYEMSEKTRVD